MRSQLLSLSFSLFPVILNEVKNPKGVTSGSESFTWQCVVAE